MTANKNGRSVRSILLAPTPAAGQDGSMLPTDQIAAWLEATDGEVRVDYIAPYFRVHMTWNVAEQRYTCGGSETTLQSALAWAFEGYRSCCQPINPKT
jgi:hypothetical protein